ncbi:uncharacterized protein LOC6544270 [Drosophila erecta]|uniref:Gamma tubulin complex component protein N-terminal domain-containing protein n=1 Tax=Drosophila erecta TaxID=7220 RepID=B3NG81_DROER|nr:uncharacterized protein LOC6544270 [Drosophila erecta]EDV50982.1 uncharacterized protein Dere_GG14151 [Drosophila erecta]
MQADECQEVIDRNLPQLVRLLLESPIDGKKNYSDPEVKVDSDTIEKCLAYARHHVADPNVMDCQPDAVWVTMNHFLERYRCERIAEFGDTFNQLANVVLNHPICVNHKQPNLHWRLIDFVLSVNYKAFHSVRRNFQEMEQKRKNILDALTVAIKSSQLVPKDAKKCASHTKSIGEATKPTAEVKLNHKKKQKPKSLRAKATSDHIQRLCDEIEELSSPGNMYLEMVRPQIPKERPTALDISDGSYSLEHSLNQVEVNEKFALKEAKMELKLNLVQNEPFAEKPAVIDYFKNESDMLYRIQTTWWQVDVSVCKQPGNLVSSFHQGYADFLIFQLRESQTSIRKMSEEYLLLSELIVLFFASANCGNFTILNDNWELRTDELKHLQEGPFLGEIISSIKHMRHLREFIETHAYKRIMCDRLETFKFFSVALKQLLRPVMEFLVHFERRLTKGIEPATLQHFIETSRSPLERIKLLYKLSQNNKEELPFMRSLRTLDTLFTNTFRNIQPKLLRSLSASLLLHALQAYCQFLDNWWSTGDFADCHEEFLFERILVNGQTEYVLRKSAIQTEELLKWEFFDIIQGHVLDSSEAVAVLHDAKTIGDFNTLHGIVQQIPLHSLLIDGVLKELAPYQIKIIKDSTYVPDILQQLQSTDHDALRRLFYSFHMETRPDPRQPAGHSIDELLKNFLACADYTPVSEIITQELKRLLHRRTRLAKSYICGLVQEFQVERVVRHLRSVFLLWNYDQFLSEFELFFESLRRNQLMVASYKLEQIVVSQDFSLGHMFKVRLTDAHPDFICLKVRYDPLLKRVISQEQIETMNSCFRLILNLNFSLYRLHNLPPLDYSKHKRLLDALRSIQTSLIFVLEEQLSHPCKLFRIMQDLHSYNSELDEYTSLGELRRNQELFVLHMQKYLREEQFACSLPEILKLSRVFWHRWERTRVLIDEYRSLKATNIFEGKYELLRLNYLLETLKKCKAIGCFLGHI